MVKRKLKSLSVVLLAALMTVCLAFGITSFSNTKTADAAVEIGNTIDFASASTTSNGVFTSYNGVYYTRLGGGTAINSGLGVQLKAKQIFVFEVTKDALFSFTIKGSKAKSVTFTFEKLTDAGYEVVTNAGTTKFSSFDTITASSTTAATIPTISLTAAPYTFTTEEYKIEAGKYALVTPLSGSVDSSLSMGVMEFKSSGPSFDIADKTLTSKTILGVANTTPAAADVATYLNNSEKTLTDSANTSQDVTWTVEADGTDFIATATATTTDGSVITGACKVTVTPVKDITASIIPFSFVAGLISDEAELLAYLNDGVHNVVDGNAGTWAVALDATIDYSAVGVQEGVLVFTPTTIASVLFDPVTYTNSLSFAQDTRAEITALAAIDNVVVNQGEDYVLPTTLSATANGESVNLTTTNFSWDRAASTANYGTFVYTATATAALDDINYKVGDVAPTTTLTLIVKKPVNNVQIEGNEAAWTLGAYGYRWDTGEELTATSSALNLGTDSVVALADSDGIVINIISGVVELNHFHTVGMAKIDSAATSYIEITVPEGFVGTLSLKVTCYTGRPATLGVYSVDAATGAETLVNSNTNFASPITAGSDTTPPADYTAVFNEYTVNLSGSTTYRLKNVSSNTFYFGEIAVSSKKVETTKIDDVEMVTADFAEGATLTAAAEKAGYQQIGWANYELTQFYALNATAPAAGTYTAVYANMDVVSMALRIDGANVATRFKVENTFYGLSSDEIRTLVASGNMAVLANGNPIANTEVINNVLYFNVNVTGISTDVVDITITIVPNIGGVASNDATNSATTRYCADETLKVMLKTSLTDGYETTAADLTGLTTAQSEYMATLGLSGDLYLGVGFTVAQVQAVLALVA